MLLVWHTTPVCGNQAYLITPNDQTELGCFEVMSVTLVSQVAHEYAEISICGPFIPHRRTHSASGAMNRGYQKSIAIIPDLLQVVSSA